MTKARSRRLLPLLLLAASVAALCLASEGSEQMDFGVRAAKKGLWREALFRWEKASKLQPANARILNNLAVAYEIGGDFDKAEAMYREAQRLAPDNKDIRQNHDLFTAYYKELLSRKQHQEMQPSPPPAPETQSAPDSQAPEEKPPDATHP
jgi:Flp pilus assembly protein TadD